MHRTTRAFMLVIALTLGHLAVGDTAQAQGDRAYQVKITNLTQAQSFTPILLAAHSPDVRMFFAGTAASPELQALAETGNTAPLAAVLAGLAGVSDMTTSAGLLSRGVTVALMITAGASATRLSLAAMLIPTNDAFVGLNTELPHDFATKEVYANVYDAGSEWNDELCASIPGPAYSECGGPGGGATIGSGEGAITIHRGIQGVGDFDASIRDWRNPGARVRIRRID